MEVVWIASAFVLGIAARQVGLPPLVGYLIAGFALGALGLDGGEALDHVAHLGVLMLLFTIGLKLRLATLLRPEVFVGGLAHLLIVAAGFALALVFGLTLAPGTAGLLGVALAFSSTVFAAKTLEENGELKSFHGRAAIGILIFQDLAAVAAMSLLGAEGVSPWALAWLGLPIAKRLLQRGLQLSGHGELMLLYGLILALGIGGAGFATTGLSAELGALILGTLIADHPRAHELGRGLWSLRDLLLVGFFLNIGMTGLPTVEALALPLKTGLYLLILLGFRLRARSSMLAALALANYSEFGLILAGVGVRHGRIGEEWLVALAITVATSFVVAAPLNASAHRLYAHFEPRLLRWQSDRRHPDDAPLSLAGADVVVMGLGRIGKGAYASLEEQGYTPIGLDSDPLKVAQQEEAGRRALYADAEDPDFWQRLDLRGVRAVLLALPEMNSKCVAARELRRIGFQGLITATNAYPDEVEILERAGVDETFDHYETAGDSFAQCSQARLEVER
jgi:predicted Kef-type K+ transport protein